jgi:parallel beta-helix repeat protein
LPSLLDDAVIKLLTPLPSVGNSVTIDGSTQKGLSVKGGPTVILDGSATALPPVSFDIALDLTGSSDVVNDLEFRLFPNIAVGLDGSLGTLKNSTIVSNDGNGVDVAGPDNTVSGNFVGTDTSGQALGNNSFGIIIAGATGNTIVGNDVADNGLAGIYVNADHNLVIENKVGTNPAGNAALGNSQFSEPLPNGGIYVEGNHNTIGQPSKGNLVSGNKTDGITLSGTGAFANVVAGNEVGTTLSGTAALPNNAEGIVLQGGAHGNTIGGAAGNVVSGNDGDGIYFYGAGTHGNTLLNNRIGTNNVGTAKLPNKGNGILLYFVPGNTIGGGNYVSGNAQDGILIQSSSNSTITGNFIGLGTNGATLGNGAAGADLENYLGGKSIDDAVLSNDIYGNGKLGIDLGNNGVTLDHSGGLLANEPNEYQNFPVLTLATGTTVKGTLNGAAGTSYTIQVFSSPSADPSGYGQGRYFLRSFKVTTNAAGNASFTETLSSPLTKGQFVTATATDPAGNTSEFSKTLKAT